MGKAARLKAERRQARAAAPPPRPAASQRVIWLATAGLAAVIAVGVGVLLATRSSPKPPPPATPAVADKAAPAALAKAADAVGFSPNTEPGVGLLEDKPAASAQPPTNHDLLAIGTQAPQFVLKTPQGRSVSLRGLRGKVVLVEIFATWCPHCAAEAPHLQQLYASLPKWRYAFLSVNGDGEDPASVFASPRYFGLTFPVLLDPSGTPGNFHHPGAAGAVSASYRLRAFPTFYVIDAKGRITWRSDGEQPDALLRRELRRAAGA